MRNGLPDREFALRLAEKLAAKDLKILYPTLESGLAVNPLLNSGQALSEADAMIVLVSPPATKSETVSDSLSYALTQPRFRDMIFRVELSPTRGMLWILETNPATYSLADA